MLIHVFQSWSEKWSTSWRNSTADVLYLFIYSGHLPKSKFSRNESWAFFPQVPFFVQAQENRIIYIDVNMFDINSSDSEDQLLSILSTPILPTAMGQGKGGCGKFSHHPRVKNWNDINHWINELCHNHDLLSCLNETTLWLAMFYESRVNCKTQEVHIQHSTMCKAGF